jgi:hypothetical protein
MNFRGLSTVVGLRLVWVLERAIEAGDESPGR